MAAEVDGSSNTADVLLDKLKDSEISHDEFMKLIQQKVAQIVSTDPCLRGLPPDVTVDELEDVIALEQGKAITLHLRRYDDVVIPLVVLQGASVLELKGAIQRAIDLKHKRDGGKQHISWRYTWKTYWLACKNQKLTDDSEKIANYGLKNKEEIAFVKKLRRETKEKLPRRPRGGYLPQT